MNKTLKIIIATTCLMLCLFSFVTAYSYQYEYFTVNVPRGEIVIVVSGKEPVQEAKVDKYAKFKNKNKLNPLEL